MMQALAHQGQDGSQVWQEGMVGLGHQMRRDTPESLSETLPWRHPGATLTIIADARLDNRDELGQALGILPAERPHYPDSRLILLAYERWGERCPEYLLGDFAFAIWDGRHRKLFCCCDHLGRRPFFYYHDGQRFLFASEAKAILAIPGIEKKLNRKRLAAIGVRGMRFHLSEDTFYAQLFLTSRQPRRVGPVSSRLIRRW